MSMAVISGAPASCCCCQHYTTR